MRILIKDQSTGRETTLCHGSAHAQNQMIGPAAFTIDDQQLSDVVEYPRRANVRVFDRGNLRHTVTFSAQRECASLHAAAIWILQFRATLLRFGDLILEDIGTDGRLVRLRFLQTRLQVKTTQIGVSVRHDFTAVAAEVQLS